MPASPPPPLLRMQGSGEPRSTPFCKVCNAICCPARTRFRLFSCNSSGTIDIEIIELSDFRETVARELESNDSRDDERSVSLWNFENLAEEMNVLQVFQEQYRVT